MIGIPRYSPLKRLGAWALVRKFYDSVIFILSHKRFIDNSYDGDLSKQQELENSFRCKELFFIPKQCSTCVNYVPGKNTESEHFFSLYGTCVIGNAPSTNMMWTDKHRGMLNGGFVHMTDHCMEFVRSDKDYGIKSKSYYL